MRAALEFAAGIAIPVFAGYAVVACADREGRRGVATTFLRLGLGFGIGVGATACAYFLTLFLLGPPGAVYRVVESAILAAIGVFGWMLRRRGTTAAPGLQCDETVAPWQTWLTWCFVVALVLAFLGAVGRYWTHPLSDWDALSIWNCRAKFFFLAGNQWQRAFSPELPHTDYPLLLPCTNARLWSYLGADAAWGPWLSACLFTFGVVALLTAGLSRLRGRSQGQLAGIVLLASASFLREGIRQFADVPMAFFMLAAVLLLVLHDASRRPVRGLLLLSGFAAGLAGWTKNEGLLFLAILPAARGMIVWRRDGFRRALGEIGLWVVGALPAIAVIFIQKTCIACHNDLIGGQNWQKTLNRLCDATRHAHVAWNFLEVFVRSTAPAFVVLPLLFVSLGAVKDRPRPVRGASTALVVFFFMLAGYYLVCVTTPNKLDWQLDATCRLMMQVWPTCLLGVFLLLATPKDASVA